MMMIKMMKHIISNQLLAELPLPVSSSGSCSMKAATPAVTNATDTYLIDSGTSLAVAMSLVSAWYVCVREGETSISIWWCTVTGDG